MYLLTLYKEQAGTPRSKTHKKIIAWTTNTDQHGKSESNYKDTGKGDHTDYPSRHRHKEWKTDLTLLLIKA